MNIFFCIALVLAVFIGVDFLTAKLMKLKRTLLRNITVIILGALTVLFTVLGILNLAGNGKDKEQSLYNAYSFLLDGDTSKARECAQQASGAHSEMVMLLADCWDSNYASAFIVSDDLINGGSLNEELSEQAEKIHSLSRKMTGLDSALDSNSEKTKLKRITSDCLSLLKISEESEVEFLSGYKREKILSSNDYLSVKESTIIQMLEETPNNKELLAYSVKYYNSRSKDETAMEYARKLISVDNSPDNIVLYSDAALQYINSDSDYSEDEEVYKYLKEAKEAEKDAEKCDDPEMREELLESAEEYREKASGIKAKRVINWLVANKPIFGDNTGVFDLQMSRLYLAAGEEEKAKEMLVELINHSDSLSDKSSVKDILLKINSAYYSKNSSDEEISAGISAISDAKPFLRDTAISRKYENLVSEMLKYERMSVFISSINAENYPTIRAFVNVNGTINGNDELANDLSIDDFVFEDNGKEVSSDMVSLVEDEETSYMSIALVIDGSGSMNGSGIKNAKKAIQVCVDNMDASTQEMSIVMYSNGGEIVVPLTDDKNKLYNGISNIYASGGTVISSGIYAGIESLRNAKGVKSIILMTDGQDGSRETIEDAIEQAIIEQVAVYTVSTGNGDNEYMQNIAEKTGGSFMEAETDDELSKVYAALQNYIVNNYCFEYTVEENPEENPRTFTVGLKDYRVSSTRAYAHSGLILTEDGCYITRNDSGVMSLINAEPSVISEKDAEMGISVIISAQGMTEGAKLYINGEELPEANVVDNSAILFCLKGDYKPGNLNITVVDEDGTSVSDSNLIRISSPRNSKSEKNGGRIVLGSAGEIYADNVVLKDEYTFELSGTIVLNGLLKTDLPVTINAMSEIEKKDGKYYISSGTINGKGMAYAVLNSKNSDNYAALAYNGRLNIMNSFNFSFDNSGLYMDSYSLCDINLPGLGEISPGTASFTDKGIVITSNNGTLNELSKNLNFIFNGEDLQDKTSSAFEIITGHKFANSSISKGSVYTDISGITITISENSVDAVGTALLKGKFGEMSINDGEIAIDTSNTASIYKITGNIGFGSLGNTVELTGKYPFEIVAKGLYPDTFKLSCGKMPISADNISDCFVKSDSLPVFTTDYDAKHEFDIDGKPYYKQISQLLSDIDIHCDSLEFVETESSSGIKLYNSSEPEKYVIYMGDTIRVSVNLEDEIMLFGSKLGGEITGYADISNRYINLKLDVNGHIDNVHSGTKFDGKCQMTAEISRNMGISSAIPITISCGKQKTEYNSTITGGEVVSGGFGSYSQEGNR